eukprot:GHUV01000453.1.p1 GENE.GHUV01000453.1~~GHUV01000453.1.p1  ORF type:complete len:337 (+),score=139.14 GHUV01000453.1:266-1276(+)
MTVTMYTDPVHMSRDAAYAGGLMYAQPGAQQGTQPAPSPLDLSGRQPEIAERAIEPDQDLLGSRTPPHNPRSPAYDASPAGATGFSPLHLNMAQKMQQQGAPTAEKLARGIIAVGDMAAASISKTSVAVGAAITNYVQHRMDSTPPLSQPLTVSRGYVSRLNLIQKFTQPAASVADVAAMYTGEMLYWVMQAALAVYNQLAAMKVLPQITASAKTDAAGVPINPVSGGLPMAGDELAAFKLVGAALLMAYVQVYDALEEAAQLLFRQASTAGQRYLAHRHGGEAADVAAAALALAADVMTLTLNWFRLMGRAFFSKTATKTARAYLIEMIPDLHLD